MRFDPYFCVTLYFSIRRSIQLKATVFFSPPKLHWTPQKKQSPENQFRSTPDMCVRGCCGSKGDLQQPRNLNIINGSCFYWGALGEYHCALTDVLCGFKFDHFCRSVINRVIKLRFLGFKFYKRRDMTIIRRPLTINMSQYL